MNTQKLPELQKKYGELDAGDLLQVMIGDVFKNKIALISSFGADAALLLAIVSEIDNKTPVLFLETGKHFPETLQYVEALKNKLGLQNLNFLTPDPELLNRIDEKGDLWNSNPDRCCWMRKVEPLDRAVKELGIEALITGRKRYQNSERAKLETIELDDKNIFRINPLANWDKARQKQEAAKRDLPAHPLVAQGYLSIGCAPCTSIVKAGEDERAGRWRHTAKEDQQKTECGLHISGLEIRVSGFGEKE
ncbi:MAG: phosphoadenylyl-sulfate reductase [Pseudomonadota bacterium]